MDEKEFAIEYVKRIKRPATSKTDIQMVNIVVYQKQVPLHECTSDETLEKLFRFGNGVHIGVYKFIRDNQHLFLS